MSQTEQPAQEEAPKPNYNKLWALNSGTSGARSEAELPVGVHPIQLYSLATPNGQKITVALEELGVKYDAWRIDIVEGEQFTTGFVAINPNSKIPALVDKEGPGGKPISVFESGSILLYLAEKYGGLIPKDPALRTETLTWLFFQMGAAPYIGQFGHFARKEEKIQYAIDRYATETQRLLDVLDKRLENRTFLVAEEFTIADIAWYPWIYVLFKDANAAAALGTEKYANVKKWIDTAVARPSAARGLKVNSSELREYHSEP